MAYVINTRRFASSMSLRTYAQGRLVILSADATALDAARAMDSNRIGTVLVQDGGAPKRAPKARTGVC